MKTKDIQYISPDLFAPKDAWDALSLAAKSETMKVAVRNGITDLKTIREKYNEFAEGGDTKWTMEDEDKYMEWRQSLPDNLRLTNDNDYDMRAAFKAGMQPILEADGLYHLGSRDPETGRIFKSPHHPTYLQAINTDARMGYYPRVDDKGQTYTQTWEGNKFAEGGIHIKPENRGKFTALKERTGHSATWFKEHGTPTQKKMATFALNARHWKHGLGGNLFSGEEEGSQQMNIFRRPNGEYFYQASPDSEEITVTPLNTLFENPALWTYTDANGKVYSPRQTAATTQGSIIEKEDEGPLVEAAKNYLRELQYDINNGVPIRGKYTIPAIAAAAALPVVGEAAAPILANPYVDAGLISASAGHGLNHAINEGIDGWGDAAMTALEVTPLGRVIKPMVKETAAAAENFRYPIGQWNGRRGFVLNSEYVNPEGVNVSGSTYTLDPIYGWRKASTEDTPIIEWAEAKNVGPFRFTEYKESPFQMHLKRAKAKGYDTSSIKVIDLTKDSPERTEYINNSGLVGSFEEKLNKIIERINKGGGAGNPKGTRYILHTNPDNLDARLSHELNHLLQIPNEPVPKGTVYGGWMNIYGDYFKRFNNTDIAARLSQIRDYYGQTGKEPLTESMLKYAREHYEEDTGLKNKVQEMLWNTGDLRGLAEWGNKYATGLIPFGFISPFYLNNE